MAFGFGLGGALGGLSLLGGAFLKFQAGREQAAAAEEDAQQLQRQRQAASLTAKRQAQQLAQEENRAIGTLRARMAGQGLDLNTGTARRLVNLTSRRFQQAEDDAETFRELEEQGFTSAIGAARRARTMAGINQYVAPSVSLLSGFTGVGGGRSLLDLLGK